MYQYIHADDLINRELISGLTAEIPELQGIDLDGVLTRKIAEGVFWDVDGEETVAISVTG